jgi:predicted metal-dependent phosphoesterase TrpH
MAQSEELQRFDLQAHSIYSDGELPPEQVVESAAAAGVELLALTDHDTIEGVPAALAAAAIHGIRVIPAVEISAIDDGHEPPCELHILGYDIAHDSSEVKARLQAFVDDRRARTLRMAAALRELGFALDERSIEQRVAAGRSIGRLHLAEGALAQPENAERLRREQIEDVGDFIRAYLVEGTPAFRMRETPTIAQAVEMIHAAGGIAIWAHPFWDFKDPATVAQTIIRFQELGIDGVEAFYITHSQEQTAGIVELCQERALLMTGSSDFHGPRNSLFSRFRNFETYGLTPNLGPLARP